MKGEKFLIVGRDDRMFYCKNELIKKGYEAECYVDDLLINYIDEFKYIVLPLKSFKDGYIFGTGLKTEEIKDRLIDGQRVFYGIADGRPFDCKGYSYYNESFVLKNSRLTAQGVLRLILENVVKDLMGCSVAVLGYGFCGKAICRTLNDNGLKVTDFSRNSLSKASAINDGCCAEDISEIDSKIDSFDIIVNTIPCNVISRSGIDKLNHNNIYIEIASYPYGFRVSDYNQLNFNYILASGLPGKFTPESAGAYIADTIVEILKE